METDDKSFSENPSRQERIINSIPYEKTRLRGQRVRGIPAVVESRLCLKRLPVVKTESLPPLPYIYTDMQGTETASEETWGTSNLEWRQSITVVEKSWGYFEGSVADTWPFAQLFPLLHHSLLKNSQNQVTSRLQQEIHCEERFLLLMGLPYSERTTTVSPYSFCSDSLAGTRVVASV